MIPDFAFHPSQITSFHTLGFPLLAVSQKANKALVPTARAALTLTRFLTLISIAASTFPVALATVTA